MSRSLHTDPYPSRAARRLDAPRGRRAAEPRVLRRRARLAEQQRLAPEQVDRPEPIARPTTPYPPPRLPIRESPARPGFLHPATVGDVTRLLDFFGPELRYGLRAVELRHAVGADRSGPLLAALLVPGVVILYEQPRPPWTVPGQLLPRSRSRLERAGARVDSAATSTRIDWPGTTLRDFLLFDGLLHEIGHHLVQHGSGRRTARVRRTADHERYADGFAARCRERWTAAAAPRVARG
ncbi:hypothetical protein [Plantactinospora sp. BB1]|uniref:hypothetical protein n=1 Tax=Plantactinospora sp. BB1 TaxID=2071627 RepID=UPI000D15AA15|nr:hypothetical protein [Plantactinospora sp. BB1]AVT40884.1 hypothetical protein C6W10_35530 [Plantactinospora sp. BB1]